MSTSVFALASRTPARSVGIAFSASSRERSALAVVAGDRGVESRSTTAPASRAVSLANARRDVEGEPSVARLNAARAP